MGIVVHEIHEADASADTGPSVSGELVDVNGERFYAIRHVDKMPPFFISVVSSSDHWLFVSSRGGLTAGRVSADRALFPYITVDKIHDSALHTGSRTLCRIVRDEQTWEWEPFNPELGGRFASSRHLYKNLLGNKLCFEEINHDLGLKFRYTWKTSDAFGFIRTAEITNLAAEPVAVEVLDGLQNILPAGTPRFVQTNSSNLVDAYKWSELDTSSGLAMFALYSGITDRAEPYESLRANTVFSLGLSDHKVLISSDQLEQFRAGASVQAETRKRGIRGSYLVNFQLDLNPGSSQQWHLVADLEKTQSQVITMMDQLRDQEELTAMINASVRETDDALARIIAASDGFQLTAEENVSLHHYANVLFNVLRGGIYADQYRISSDDLRATIRHFNQRVFQEHQSFLQALPDAIELGDLQQQVQQRGDANLERLCLEYLPITFGRRHGDPSRPWNQFAIRLRDDQGNRLLSYEGNWRDIFQNWEALTLSFPEYVENIIAKFVNASTIDGYNPYRITKQGIDWEIEDPEDPWSYIGYWGDHQIIYLLKLLEQSQAFHPQRLHDLLYRPLFSYANVPYRINDFERLLQDAKNTVTYDEALEKAIEQRIARVGGDGKLLLNPDETVYQVNLLEKLLVPLLSKLGNLVVDGGIWMNTQRPEWNDANNALVGQGLSMVTLYYLRRYLSFMQALLQDEQGEVELTNEVADWLQETAAAAAQIRAQLDEYYVAQSTSYEFLDLLGQIASRFRDKVYQQTQFDKRSLDVSVVHELLSNALPLIDHSIRHNLRDDDLYNAYNLLSIEDQALEISTLYPMLEGQVAALSSGAVGPEKTVRVLQSLFASRLYRQDQNSFILYPDRDLPGFLQKNLIPPQQLQQIPLLKQLVDESNHDIVETDGNGNFRFNADLVNRDMLEQRLEVLRSSWSGDFDQQMELTTQLFEEVFNHKEFTGRSGGMFGFEGLGCIYWHMVSKLLLAVQERFFAIVDEGDSQATAQQVGELYYRVRGGIGFNKQPAEYGAFPTDPYSHTPGHAGAQQPGMTGQVKEEIVTRFGELGLRINAGRVLIQPRLLRGCEFLDQASRFRYLDVQDQWQEIDVPADSLAFTWWQVPFVYQLGSTTEAGIEIQWVDGTRHQQTQFELDLPTSQALFTRNGKVEKLVVTLHESMLFSTR